MKTLLALVALVALSIVLSGCFAGPNPLKQSGPESWGFFGGLWHGWIFFFSFIFSIFDGSINVYAVNNNGFFYNFGFFLGAGSSLGGTAASGRSR